MILNFPNRYVWLVIGIVMLILLQSGCTPIQAPTAMPPVATDAPAKQTDSSTETRQNSTSPNGEWTATTLFQYPEGGDEYYQSLTITHTSGSPSYTLIDGWYPKGLGYTVVVPLFWSQDGNRFYYTNRANPDGCGILFNGSDLYQVDLTNGQTVELLPANTTTRLGLAPDEQHIAYLAIGEPALQIQDLDTNEKMPVALTSIYGDNDVVGAFIWSPDSTKLAFAVAHNPCMGGWAESTSIYVLNLDTMNITPRLEEDDRQLIPVAWPSEDVLLVENQVPYDRLDQKHQFTFDLATDTIAPAETSAITTTTTITQ